LRDRHLRHVFAWSVSVKRYVIVLLLLVAGVALLGYGLFAYLVPSATVRYRLTLEADVAGHPAVGSGVIEVTREDNRRLFGSLGGFGAEVKGQAVILDLDGRGSLFALLHGSGGSREDKTHPIYLRGVVLLVLGGDLQKNIRIGISGNNPHHHTIRRELSALI
jgi:hypothetical protein